MLHILLVYCGFHAVLVRGCNWYEFKTTCHVLGYAGDLPKASSDCGQLRRVAATSECPAKVTLRELGGPSTMTCLMLIGKGSKCHALQDDRCMLLCRSGYISLRQIDEESDMVLSNFRTRQNCLHPVSASAAQCHALRKALAHRRVRFGEICLRCFRLGLLWQPQLPGALKEIVLSVESWSLGA